MSSVKLKFCDLVVELESNELAGEQAERAMNMLAFLVQERLRYEECCPAEEEDMDVVPPAKSTISPVLPPEVLQAYL